MKLNANWSPYQWIFYLTAGLLYGATLLRLLLSYQDDPAQARSLGLLTAWLVLFLGEPLLTRRWPQSFPLYLAVQTILVGRLIYAPDLRGLDFFALLFTILSMQVMQHLDPRAGAVWIGLFALLMGVVIPISYGIAQGLGFTLLISAVNVLMASYTLATRRAQAAQAQNQTLAQELQTANRQLQDYAEQLERLAVARERNHLARELHDSVTQTIFSMNLAAQSAGLLFERDPGRVRAQLEQLDKLAQGALAEMQLLISKLHPVNSLPAHISEGEFVTALRRHLAERWLPEGLAVSLEVEGNAVLEAMEAQSLFRIVQEALNNIVKHAGASQAHICLHLTEPFWVEVEDRGQGFDLQQALASGGVGLAGMEERAVEAGWKLQVTTAPGAGTRIRVEKRPSRESVRR